MLSKMIISFQVPEHFGHYCFFLFLCCLFKKISCFEPYLCILIGAVSAEGGQADQDGKLPGGSLSLI